MSPGRKSGKGEDYANRSDYNVAPPFRRTSPLYQENMDIDRWGTNSQGTLVQIPAEFFRAHDEEDAAAPRQRRQGFCESNGTRIICALSMLGLVVSTFLGVIYFVVPETVVVTPRGENATYEDAESTLLNAFEESNRTANTSDGPASFGHPSGEKHLRGNFPESVLRLSAGGYLPNYTAQDYQENLAREAGNLDYTDYNFRGSKENLL